MKNIKRKGFTLVELLIVIVVIGILSAMMMLSSTEAVTSARASNIVSNLRNFKTAALAMYVDYLDSMDHGNVPDGNTAGSSSHDILVKYMNKGDSGNTDPEIAKYNLVKNDTNKEYYICYNGASDTRIQAKLQGRAASVGLLGSASSNDVYASGSNVYMFITRYQQ